MQTNMIYLDNNATTPIDPRVIEAMMPYFADIYANASSTNKFGVKAYNAVKAARQQVANIIGAESNEIIFTSGATEAINLAIKGASEAYKCKGTHIITASTEHSAVIDTCKYLETQGCSVTFLPVSQDGLIDINELQSAVRDDTFLISIMYVNNETGVIQPIKQIAEIAHQHNILFMSDCTQAVGKIPINVDDLGIDLLCLSGHKLYGPKGVGALYARKRSNRVKITPLMHGGGHEGGLRSGTLNVPGIVALGVACEISQKEMQKNSRKILTLRNKLEQELLKIDRVCLNGNPEQRLYNTSNICFTGADSDAIMMKLGNYDDQMIIVSKGSACNSSSIMPSHVLTAMGLNETLAFNSIRFSIGRYNTDNDIDLTISRMYEIITKLRAM